MPKITRLCLHLLKLCRKKCGLFSGDGVFKLLTPLYTCRSNKYNTDEFVARTGAVHDSYSIVPRPCPLCTGVAVCVSTVTVTDMVLPGTLVDVAVVVVVAAVSYSFIMLPATCQPTTTQVYDITSVGKTHQ